MSLQDLSLPIDIPWKLVATSNDMLATHVDRFPNAMWKSSLAIFSYDPDLSDLPDEFSDRELTFLKVVASITSYAPTCADMPPPPDPAAYGEEYAAYEGDYTAWQQTVAALKQLEHSTYPCCGALVQVAIYPKQGDTTDVTKLAHFTSMEPQKRELIEVATESGESMTQSKSDVNVRKGLTNTNSTENMDVFTGMNASAQVGGTGGGFGISGQWGTIKRATSEVVDSTTTDTSRDKRETSSHTTNLSQLYHLLNSYHLGTNRAIFFLQPRPHTVQQKDRFTFIQGPQEIEGIQEFFLVVNRPKGVTLGQYCVDALLYTAHLDQESMRLAILEPKTAETPWIELWATSRVKSNESQAHRSVGTTLPLPVPSIIDPINTNNIVTPQDITVVTDWLSQIEDSIKIEDDAAAIISREQQPADDKLAKNNPVILDQTITTAVLRASSANIPFTPPDLPEPGWRIDRTRGIGGYDLWEDPTNYSASPLGKGDKAIPPPQAFVDIVSFGSLDELTLYYPDCALRVRAIAWPVGADTEALYHARVKVYFIRDDTPTLGRTIPMFVTARGVSTCDDSPFSQFYATPADPSKLPPDIAGEASIHPVNVAPWTTPEPAPIPSPPGPTPSASQQSGGQSNTSQTSVPLGPPLTSARPSGLEPVVVGAARAKMANTIANDVRYQLKAMMTCKPGMFISFRYSDLVYQKLAKQRVFREIDRLVAVADQHADLAYFVATHPAAQRLPIRAIAPRPVTARSLPAASATFPALTLGGLSESELSSFHKAGVRTTLDLLDVSLTDLARRLEVGVTDAARKRLKAIGVNLPG